MVALKMMLIGIFSTYKTALPFPKCYLIMFRYYGMEKTIANNWHINGTVFFSPHCINTFSIFLIRFRMAKIRKCNRGRVRCDIILSNTITADN